MKKQLITQNDIRLDLLAKINKAKKLSIFLKSIDYSSNNTVFNVIIT